MRYSLALAVLLLSVCLFDMAVAQNVKVAAKPKEAGRWALLIGVDEYLHCQSLRYAGADMRAMRDRLVATGFPDKQVFLLDDKAEKTKYRPFKPNIERELEQVLGMVERDDLIVVAFSGHGVHLDGHSYLCPTEAQLKDDMTLVSLEEVYDRLQKCPASLKLLLVDACRNDPRREGEKGVLPNAGTRQFAESLERPPHGILLLTSCAPGQISMEEKDFGQGVFMHFVLEGIGGKAADQDGSVSLMGLFKYANKQTKLYVHDKFNGHQTPALKGDIQDDFELARVDYRPEVPRPSLSNGKTITNSIGMKLALIPAGEFMMGSPQDEKDRSDDEGPQHRVRITKPFYMGIHEVTVGQFRKFVADASYKTEAEKDGKGGYGMDGTSWTQKPEYTWRNPGFPQSDDHPVVNVSWNDAVTFCEWLSRKEGKTCRLPTEAQWEYACRAGTATRYYSGDDSETLAQMGNVADASAKAKFSDWNFTIAASDGYVFTAPVGSFRPNAFGLYDMHGNVFEWCADWYDSSYYAASPTDDPSGPASGSFRVVRGGGWYYGAGYCRSACRFSLEPGYRFYYLGFRVSLVSAE